MKHLRKHCEGANEGQPEYYYGVIDGFGGSIWPVLHFSESDARKAAKDLHGRVVIVAVRPIEDAEGEDWPLPVRTREMEIAEAEAEMKEAEEIFNEVIARAALSQEDK